VQWDVWPPAQRLDQARVDLLQALEEPFDLRAGTIHLGCCRPCLGEPRSGSGRRLGVEVRSAVGDEHIASGGDGIAHVGDDGGGVSLLAEVVQDG